MPVWIALFRGINVGGKNVLPMKLLKEIVAEVNCTNVRSYIQSGNLVFESRSRHPDRLAARIEKAVEDSKGFRPAVLLLTEEQLAAAVEGNPFPTATSDPKSLHFFFLREQATNPDLQLLNTLRTGREAFVLHDHVFYLHAPDGISRSKLAAGVEKCLGVPVTARNYRTVDKILALVEE